MDWLIVIAFFGFWWWRAARAGRRAAELAPTGMFRSPLYLTSMGLVALLFALVFYIGHIHHHHSKVPAFLWLAALAIMVALLLLRRALKWRFPI